MFINYTITKKILEILIKKTYSKFGNITTSSLLDSFKLLGFGYATNASISINIEDLKIPKIKRELINNTLFANNYIKEQWKQGLLTELERYQSTIDIWNNVTNVLKDKIISYYQTFDPVNNLYIMAFSGARGNISQVRQLVGMRGLMSDQDGKIIDLPISSNFREGLSLVDYIISAYGARKGIVDTALKTADSGYLTRRLIYGAQDLIIRITDCNTNIGIYILLNKNTNIVNLIGRYCISVHSKYYPYKLLLNKEKILTLKDLKNLKTLDNFYIKIRSIITCKGIKAICQKCYGWDLTSEQIVSLGNAVGIIAAQSIGEPGTQLTMRTFHTGGIFTGESLQQIVAPFSGKILKKNKLKYSEFRTNHGLNIFKLLNKTLFTLINWKNEKKSIALEKGTFLYNKNLFNLKKNELIAEIPLQSFVFDFRKFKPLYTMLAGKCYLQNTILYQDKNFFFTLKNLVFWILSEIHYNLIKTTKIFFKKNLFINKIFGLTKITSPINGIIHFEKNDINIVNTLFIRKINLFCFNKQLINYKNKSFIIIKNYQYIDKYTIIAYIYSFPTKTSSIHKIQKKSNKIRQIISYISQKNKMIINSEQITNYINTFVKDNTIYTTKLFNTTALYNYSGFIYKYNGYTQILQHAIPNFLNKGTILTYTANNTIFKNKNFALLLNYIQQTEDIIQGLPKVEELIEAQTVIKECYITRQAGIYLLNVHFNSVKISKFNKLNLIINYVNTKNTLSTSPSIQYSNFFNKNHYNFNKNDF